MFCINHHNILLSGTVLIIVGGVKFSNAAEPDPHSFENGVGELVAGSVLICLGMVAGRKYYYDPLFTTVLLYTTSNGKP